MSGFVLQLLFLAVGGGIAPPLLLLTILFLGSRRPLPNATPLVVAAVPLVTGYIRLLWGSVVRKEAPLPGLCGSRPSRFPGAYDG